MVGRAIARAPGALLFDVFGTVVDWRGSVKRELARVGDAHGVRADWGAFADAWRAGYRPAMDRVRRGEEPWQPLDSLHLRMLRGLVGRFGLDLGENELAALNRVWHRLTPWPDVRSGLRRLEARLHRRHLVERQHGAAGRAVEGRAPAVDRVFSAELFRHYKPDAEVYRGAAALLALDPADVMLVAAHKDDLAAARRCGLQTAYVHRPLEFGPSTADGVNDRRSTLNADDLGDLAAQLGL